MAATVEINLDRKLYVGQYDISGQANELTMPWGREELDAKASGDATNLKRFGLETCSATAKIYSVANTNVDDYAFGLVNAGTINMPVTMCTRAGTTGQTAYFLDATAMRYNTSFPVGQLPMADFYLPPTSQKLVRGFILQPKATITTTGDGTAYQLGAVAATQYLYAAIHVFSASGTLPTLDVVIANSATEGGSYTTRGTFTQKTAAGYQFLTPVVGAPFTDTWWRVSRTIGGTNTPTFSCAVIVGIQR